MYMKNKILLLGSTGRTGKWLLEELLAKGYQVNILIRDATKISIQSDLLTVFEGTPAKMDDLERAFEGCTVVFSALNTARTSDFPWAKLRTPKDFLAKVIQNIIKLSKSYSIESVIVISAWGVAETRKDIPFWFRWTIDFSNIKYGYWGHEQQEKLLINSDLNYTIIRPVGLTNAEKSKPIIVTKNNTPKPNLLISRKNVAIFMVGILENLKAFSRQILTISEE
jgi:uncharacterized protein YbjT (DUF2867 family)